MIKPIYSFLFFVLLLSSSCVRYKNIAYIQDRYTVTDSAKYSISVADGGDLVLKPEDNVYINVYGLEYNQLESFNKEKTLSNSSYNELSLYIKGYIIDREGKVELPIFGKVELAGLTLAQAKDTLQARIDEYLIGAIVDIRLLSYQVTLLGEITRPGKYLFYRREINLIDALAKAGDLTSFGDARHVIVIRSVGGHSETYNFDLTSSGFFADPNFWLRPNDVVYVKPLKTKAISVNSPTLNLVFTSLTTVILLLTYMQYLK